jgi:hypothetical protein|tara:strand:+ start:210 stop:374 length:165 start_codon:yes stop_codon:yes gene_type:complete
MFETQSGIKGVHLESSEGRSVVMVLESPSVKAEEDKRYYLGVQNWAPNTEVRKA